MIYFEHYVREGGLASLSSAVVLCPAGAEAACRDVAAEILDLFPGASVRVQPDSDPVPACDLAVAVFTAPWRFPFHDVVYDSLDRLRNLRSLASSARFVMVYGATWRSVEVMSASAVPGFVRKRLLEARIGRFLERSKLMRRLLRPLYRQV